MLLLGAGFRVLGRMDAYPMYPQMIMRFELHSGYAKEIHLLYNKPPWRNTSGIMLKEMGQAISTPVTIDENIKRRIPNLHQNIIIYFVPITYLKSYIIV